MSKDKSPETVEGVPLEKISRKFLEASYRRLFTNNAANEKKIDELLEQCRVQEMQVRQLLAIFHLSTKVAIDTMPFGMCVERLALALLRHEKIESLLKKRAVEAFRNYRSADLSILRILEIDR